MSLHRLVYLSYARSGLDYTDLRNIMDQSEENNSAAGITGMLCYGNEIFLQILEGNRKTVNQTYHRIAKDDRHHSPEIIGFSEIQSRCFNAWSMKLIQLEGKLAPNLQQLILKFSDFSKFSPDRMSAEQCFQFMKELYEIFVLG